MIIPEIVELKISAEIIKPLVTNKILKEISFGSGRYNQNNLPVGYSDFTQSNPQILNVQTRGKLMYWSFDNNWYMLCTFGMTGQFSSQAGKHLCCSFQLQDISSNEETTIHFNDPRHFGTIKFISGKQQLLSKLNFLGWDAFQDDLNKYLNWIHDQISQSSKPIGQLLLDQFIFAGVGNYIRAEALYLSKISPWRIGKDFDKDSTLNLCCAIIQIINESYQHQGATLLTYKDPYGNEGKYSSCFKVYGRKIDPFGNSIVKELTPEGRSIHWCPTIQE